MSSNSVFGSETVTKGYVNENTARMVRSSFNSKAIFRRRQWSLLNLSEKGGSGSSGPKRGKTTLGAFVVPKHTWEERALRTG